MDWGLLFLNFILTIVFYMAFPLVSLLVNSGRFEKKRARRIALWNSIIVGAICCVITITNSPENTTWSGGPAFLYYFINSAILTDKSQSSKKMCEDDSARIDSYNTLFSNEQKIPNESISDTENLSKESAERIRKILLQDKIEDENILHSTKIETGKTSNIDLSNENNSDEEKCAQGHEEMVPVRIDREEMKIRFCAYCGEKLPEGSIYCYKCGKKILFGDK